MLLEGPDDGSVRHQVPAKSDVDPGDCKSENALCKSNRIDLGTPDVLIGAVVGCLQSVVVSRDVEDDAQRLSGELGDIAAVPTADGPNILTVEQTRSGETYLRGIREDGIQIW